MHTRYDRSNFEGLTSGNRSSSAASLRPRTRLIWCLIPLLALHLAGCQHVEVHVVLPDDIAATAQETMPETGGHEIDIRFVNGGGQEPLIQPASGWPLTLSLTANEERLLGIGTGDMQGIYPMRNETGFLIFEDPDGCPSWTDRVWQENHVAFFEAGEDTEYPDCTVPPPPVPWPMDETWLEVTPGLTLPDPNPEVSGDQPQINRGVPARLQPIGPGVGSKTDDYGYGANARLPGLVVVADAGPGIVTDEHFNRSNPLMARNLAGFFHSVSCELKDSRQQTSVLAHMNVPKALFSPVLLVDEKVEESRCGRPDAVIGRVDGGSEECLDTSSRLEEHVVTVRAFVVNGQAPEILTDLDGNGRVDVLDARRSGHELLSVQAIFRFTQLDGRLYPCAQCYYFDFDGNGLAGAPVQPGGPGGLVNPPR